MKALLLIAHGSRRQESNNEVIELGGVMTDELINEYPIVETAFLELAIPLIPDAIEMCINQHATEIDIVPYFLAAGRHVSEDIPNEIANARRKYPHISMVLYPHIGGSPMMTNLIKSTLSGEHVSGMNNHIT
jgi:sirohydrochlorin ferrochelatase